MGTLRYGSSLEVDLDDKSLFFLDALLSEVAGSTFQLHLFPAGPSDGNLLSLRIGAGVPVALEYFNGPDPQIDIGDLLLAAQDVREGRFISLPRRGKQAVGGATHS
jgi:hypothetical protein